LSKRAFADLLKQMKKKPPKPKARGGQAKPRPLMPGEPLEPYRAGAPHPITEPEGSHDA
jgi:hypothetical protein